MATQEFFLECKLAPGLAPASYASAQTGAAVDSTGWEATTYILDVGAWTSGAMTGVKLQECATLGGTYTDVAASDMVTDFPGAGIVGATTNNTQYKVAYTGSRPFTKLVTIGTQTVIFGAFALLTSPRDLGGALL